MLSPAEQAELEAGLGEYIHDDNVWQCKYISKDRYQIGYPKKGNLRTVTAKYALYQIRSAKNGDYWTLSTKIPKTKKASPLINWLKNS